MNLRGISRLCCPVCKGKLSLISFCEEIGDFSETYPVSNKGEHIDPDSIKRVVKEGVLLCENCRVWYPVASYVPVMLVFSTPFHKRFLQQFQHESANFKQFSLPSGLPKCGECRVQETFTEEWNTIPESKLSFTYTREELKSLHKEVWLKWRKEPPANIKSVLNVGCGGLGAEAAALYEISDAEVFAIDLSFSLFRSAGRFIKRPLLHFVIASLFYPPFAENSFDLVYSQGVLHHTYSTYDAFASVARFVKRGGQLFIWVFALEDHLVYRGLTGFISKVKYGVENLFLRPIISRAPAAIRAILVRFLSLLLHFPIRMRVRNKKIWKFENTLHGIRDWITPRYAHRHSFNEVIEWFENNDFTYDLHSPATYRRLFGRRLSGIGILGNKRA